MSLDNNGSYCFKVQGQIYHYASPLHPNLASDYQFAQLYILDAEQALNQRMSIAANISCHSQTMHLLATLIKQINPFAQAY